MLRNVRWSPEGCTISMRFVWTFSSTVASSESEFSSLFLFFLIEGSRGSFFLSVSEAAFHRAGWSNIFPSTDRHARTSITSTNTLSLLSVILSSISLAAMMTRLCTGGKGNLAIFSPVSVMQPASSSASSMLSPSSAFSKLYLLGRSMKGKLKTSMMPRAFSVNSALERSQCMISGSVFAVKVRYEDSGYRR
ncbi:hypothetical protein ABW21_db0208028 [Orbilia brochopaga]|nr:hypothetical protein ABW21_db0208028 [Drechslerella brochopaga]